MSSHMDDRSQQQVHPMTSQVQRITARMSQQAAFMQAPYPANTANISEPILRVKIRTGSKPQQLSTDEPVPSVVWSTDAFDCTDTDELEESFALELTLSWPTTPSEGTKLLPNYRGKQFGRMNYRTLLLSNGLRVMLISDEAIRGPPSADLNCEGASARAVDSCSQYTAAAGLTLGFGLNCDPPNLPGLMHFLEHLILFPTRPGSHEDFTHFVHHRGGFLNGATTSSDTQFYFQLLERHFWEGLQLFAQLFAEPSITMEVMRGERRVLDAEYYRNTAMWALAVEQVLQTRGCRNHPEQTFMGNTASLSALPDAAVLYLLHQHRRLFYSAQFMTVAVQTSYSLDVMQENVVQILQQIPNNGCPTVISRRALIPCRPGFLNKAITILAPPSCVLELLWSVSKEPDSGYENHILDFIAKLLMRVFPESMHCYLSHPDRQWGSVTSVSTVERNLRVELKLEVTMTAEGYRNRTRVLEVILHYMELVKRCPAVGGLLEEHQFRGLYYHDLSDENDALENVRQLSKLLQGIFHSDHSEKLEKNLYEQLMRKILDELIPENMVITMKGSPLDQQHASYTEKWYQKKFQMKDLHLEWGDVIESPMISRLPNLELQLIRTMEVPTFPDMTYMPPHRRQNVTVLLASLAGALFYKEDSTFGVPLVAIRLLIERPQYPNQPDDYKSIGRLMESFVSSAVSRMRDSLELQELREFPGVIEMSSFSRGIIIEITMPTQYVQYSLRIMLQYAGQVYANMFGYLGALLGHPSLVTPVMDDWNPNALRHLLLTSRAAIDGLEPSLCPTYLRMLVQGRVTRQHAVRLFKQACDFSMALDNNWMFHYEQYEVAPMSDSSDTNDTLHADDAAGRRKIRSVVFGFEGGRNTPRMQSLARILEVFLGPKCWYELRAQHQIGYIAKFHQSSNCFSETLTLEVFVEPHRRLYRMTDVKRLVDEFIERCMECITEMTADQFEILKSIVSDCWGQLPISLARDVESNWAEILNNHFLFDRKERQVREIPSIKLEELVDLTLSIFGRGPSFIKYHA